MKSKIVFEGNLKIKYYGTETNVTVHTVNGKVIMSFYGEDFSDLTPDDVDKYVTRIGTLTEMKWRPRKKCMDLIIKLNESMVLGL